jgi:hypothetical protein
MYSYEHEREALFTEQGQLVLLAVRDAAKFLIGLAGAARMQEIMDEAVRKLGAFDTWTFTAALNRLVEINDLRELPTNGWGQYRVFVSPNQMGPA